MTRSPAVSRTRRVQTRTPLYTACDSLVAFKRIGMLVDTHHKERADPNENDDPTDLFITVTTSVPVPSAS